MQRHAAAPAPRSRAHGSARATRADAPSACFAFAFAWLLVGPRHHDNHVQARGDQIREELRALGCEVNDREKVWRTTDGRRGRVGAMAGGTIAIADDSQICP